MTNQRKYLISLMLFALAVVSMAVLAGLNSYKNMDTIEHIHSAWYIEQGYVPYRDFFQHHNPLLWFSMAPVIRLFGETMVTYHILNSIFILLVVGVGAMIFLICRQITEKPEAGWLSIILLFSLGLFYKVIFELRPDTPMLFFGLLAVWFFMLFLKSNSTVSICLSGLLFGISFLFLQKVIFLIAAVFIVLGFLIIKKKANWKHFLYFMLSLMMPLSALLIYIIKTNSVYDYFLTSWIFNAAPSSDNFSPFREMKLDKKHAVFWLLSIFSFLFAVFNKKTRFEQKVICFFALAMFLSLFTYNRPYEYYQLFLVSFLSVICACTIVEVLNTSSAAVVLRIAVILIIILFPVKLLARKAMKSKNYKQLNKIEFVMKNTSKNDCVYDSHPDFNLFRHDLHYFWYSTKKERGLDAYNRLTNNKYGDYDPYRLIAEKKPKFISDYLLDVNSPVIMGNYKPTQFKNLYVRKDFEISNQK